MNHAAAAISIEELKSDSNEPQNNSPKEFLDEFSKRKKHTSLRHRKSFGSDRRPTSN